MPLGPYGRPLGGGVVPYERGTPVFASTIKFIRYPYDRAIPPWLPVQGYLAHKKTPTP